jgi:hypothetical protein
LNIDEERYVVQLLIENSNSIGKVSDSVYERSLMLNSLCCSSGTSGLSQMTSNLSNKENSSISSNNNKKNNANNGNSNNQGNNINKNTTFSSTNNPNADMMFLYDNDLHENTSFAHHAQSAGSTSLSSYCGSTTSKKEKKKRRSSSLKELMNTIQNSISKFRRRSASEKNDKTTCSIITCSSMTNATNYLSNSTNMGDMTSCSASNSRMILGTSDTPFIGGLIGKQLQTPICGSLYATPRINKRNAEESLQSTTKK